MVHAPIRKQGWRPPVSFVRHNVYFAIARLALRLEKPQHPKARFKSDEVIAISAGQYHNLALKKDGTLWAWGANTDGQLGDGSFHTRTCLCRLPVSPMPSLSRRRLSTGLGSKAIRGCGLGAELGRQVGDSPYDYWLLRSGHGIKRGHPVAAGTSHSLALKSNGTVWAWGQNDHGQLGNSTFSPPAPRSKCLTWSA